MFTIFTQAFCLLVLRDDIFHTSSLFLSFMLSHSLSHRILISVAFLTLAYGAPRLFSWQKLSRKFCGRLVCVGEVLAGETQILVLYLYELIFYSEYFHCSQWDIFQKKKWPRLPEQQATSSQDPPPPPPVCSVYCSSFLSLLTKISSFFERGRQDIRRKTDLLLKVPVCSG